MKGVVIYRLFWFKYVSIIITSSVVYASLVDGSVEYCHIYVDRTIFFFVVVVTFSLIYFTLNIANKVCALSK